MPLYEYDGPNPLKKVKKVPLKAVLAYHEKQYHLDPAPKIGEIVLKRLGLLVREEVTSELYARDERYFSLMKEYQALNELAQMKNGIDARGLARMKEIAMLTAPYGKYFAIKCFVDPEIRTVEEFDALLGVLDKEEIAELYKGLDEMAKSDPVEVSDTGLILSKVYNIPLKAGLTIENMTVQQADILMKPIEEAVKRAEEQ